MNINDGVLRFAVVFITYNTFDVDLIDLYLFTLQTFSFQKVVPTIFEKQL